MSRTPDPAGLCDECAATGVIGGLCPLHAQAEAMRDILATIAHPLTYTERRNGVRVAVILEVTLNQARALLRAGEGK